MHIKKDWYLYTRDEIAQYQDELAEELRNITNPDGTRILDEKTVMGYAYGDGSDASYHAMAQDMQWNTPAELAELWTL